MKTCVGSVVTKSKINTKILFVYKIIYHDDSYKNLKAD